MSTVNIDYLKGWEGRSMQAVDDMSPFKAQALAAVFDRNTPVAAGDALPNGWQWLYFLDTPSSANTGADGHPATGEFLPPSPLPRRMWAAGKVLHHGPLRLGQSAEKKSTILSVDLKGGKSGTLLFVTVEQQISQAGKTCITEQQNLVYREMPAGPAPLPAGVPAPAEADWRDTLQPDPVLLFRYSALTYNGHRIHYDRDYAVNTEFYPGLVVHGPLLASLLSEALTRHYPGEQIASFDFRAQRPSFADRALSLCGQREGNTVALWTVDDEGFIGMKATATLADGGR